MNKELIPLQALERIKNIYILADRGNGDFLPEWLRNELLEPIEAALKSYDQIKKCHLVAIPRMSNKTSIVDELLSLQETIRVMTTILHYSYTNRFIVKQAFDEGWINEEQYQLMIETFGYYNCTGKEEPNES